MLNDLRCAFRALFKRPAFTVVAIVTLALGIGANTAIFSVIDGVLLRPLPFRDPDRLVQLKERNSRGRPSAVSHPNFLDWRQRATSLDGMSEYACYTATVLGGREPRFAQLCVVSAGFLQMMGVAPELGRTFAPEEGRPNGAPAVVVSHRFWRTALGSNSDLASLTITTLNHAVRVVGVMPDRFEFPERAEVWVPAEIDPDTSGRTAHNWRVVARLKPDASLASASAQLDAIAAQLKLQYGNDENAIGVVTTPLKDALVPPDSKSALFLLLGTVGLVLLIACANVATTLLARGEERRTEMAVRAALGAGRARLVRQLLVESSVLGAFGGSAGLLLAAWLVHVLRSLDGLALARQETIGIDATVLGFTLLLALLTPISATRSRKAAAARRRRARASARRWSSAKSRLRWCCSSARRCSFSASRA